MKKSKLIIIALIIISLLVGCTTNTPNENGEDNGTNNENNNIGQEPIVTDEIPDTFPQDLVPLYDVAKIEGVLAVGEDYHQAYYFSNSTRDDLLDKYRAFFQDKEVQIFENEYSYEVTGSVDGYKIRMYIMPYNQEDHNAITTNSQIEPPMDVESPTPTTEGSPTNGYETTVIIFISADKGPVQPLQPEAPEGTEENIEPTE